MQLSALLRTRTSDPYTATVAANGGQGFTSALEAARASASGAASVAAVGRVSAPYAATPITGLDAQTQEYLDTYKRIYAKYAATYGDGFEFTPCHTIAGNAESEAAAQKVFQMKNDFFKELAATIPDEYLGLGALVTTDMVEGHYSEMTMELSENIMLSDATRELHAHTMSDSVQKYFYLEKYGLAGLSEQEQIQSILARFGNGSSDRFAMGMGILYHTGALTAGEATRASSHARLHAMTQEMNRYVYDPASAARYDASILWHLANIAAARYEWLEVFTRAVRDVRDDGSFAALVEKLFG